MIQRFVALMTLVFITGLHAQDRPWLDTSLPNEARIQSLLDAMTVEEKMGQLLCYRARH